MKERKQKSKLTGQFKLFCTSQLTKFELCRLLAARALQLYHGAPPNLKLPPGVIDPLEIAKLELIKGRLPLKVTRLIKNNKLQELDPAKATWPKFYNILFKDIKKKLV